MELAYSGEKYWCLYQPMRLFHALHNRLLTTCVDERVDGGVCVTKPEDEDNPTFREVYLHYYHLMIREAIV